MAPHSVKVDGLGQRKDAGKVRFDLIPADVTLALAKVFTFGAAKYEPRNFERGMAFSKAYGPLLRHLNAWAMGERLDPESGLPHMAHVLCNAAFLLCWELRGMHHLDDIEPFLRQTAKKKVGRDLDRFDEALEQIRFDKDEVYRINTTALLNQAGRAFGFKKDIARHIGAHKKLARRKR